MGDEIIASGRASPNLGAFRMERHVVTVSTDTSGAGSATQSWDGEFRGNVECVATATADANAFVSASGASQGTIEVSGGPANTDVDVVVLATGDE